MQGTPPTSTQPQPSSMELGGAHIIFDALFLLDETQPTNTNEKRK
jgi:hypothetical protein